MLSASAPSLPDAHQTSGLHNQAFGEAFFRLINEAFKNYRQSQYKSNEASYNDWVKEFKARVQSTLNQWSTLAGATVGNLCRSLNDKAEQWWYFLEHPEIPPDNNQVERSLRLAVTKRKVSGRSRSIERFQNNANLLTVVQTCRRQGRSVINFFKQALKPSTNIFMLHPSLVPQF